jgi:hypothetical protein
MVLALVSIVRVATGGGLAVKYFRPDWKVLTLHIVALFVFIVSRAFLISIKVQISGFNFADCLLGKKNFKVCWTNTLDAHFRNYYSL